MGGIQQAALSLLDELARRIGCTYLSDLRFLDAHPCGHTCRGRGAAGME